MDFWQGDVNLTVWGFIVRAVVAYAFLFGIIKFLGQRTLSNLQAQDFLFAIVIGDVIGEPLVTGETNLTGPFAVALTLTGIHYLITTLALRSLKLRRFFDEEPIILISKGKILKNMMKKSKVTLDMLLMAARLNNISKLSDVEVAILEPNGEISMLTKAKANPITLDDLNKNIAPSEVKMPTVLIEDGHVQEGNLMRNQLTEDWLNNQLKENGIDDASNVFLALLESDGNLYISKQKEPYRQ
ncbi:YetF domain-containing protein [Ammoniphilus resinae]|nr:DUF421 domain-containing protein [Ammoniphilus resinae]